MWDNRRRSRRWDRRSTALRSVVEHPLRLDILCRLDGRPLTVPQVSALVGIDARQGEHHAQLLDSFGLLEKAGDGEGGQTLYVARLKDQPAWITRAVNERRHARRQSSPSGAARYDKRRASSSAARRIQ